ncbi:acyltransferase domain-containing protein [Pleurocapsales cyanobacterium LEGE 06147]|nr:acyltransferase domain-containing protein [Pleurocapsales cyanobacterium LEGE 06147]
MRDVKLEPIAIIGIGCRFPGAKDVDSFWSLLRQGKDAITEVPKDRWDINLFYDPEPAKPGKINSRWGGFLERVDRFDPGFFGISPREVEYIDPQQRLMLEVSWEALENAGLVPQKLSGSRTGVFIGISGSDYDRLGCRDFANLCAYSGTGNSPCIAANRISYLLNLRGPSVGIDTACSSSLVAVHLACQSLRSGESDLCLVGGVNLILWPGPSITFSQAQMIASDGRCKTFDDAADGYVRGEGCGVVVLKRLKDALADGNNIQGLIRGSAVNQDGTSNGLTAPNGPAQQAVIRQALENAGVAPAQISYVEAHGTGTSLGDPIEVKSLKAVLMEERKPDRPCWIGSVKTNIGHLEAAAGIAGLIKVVLQLQYGEIAPHLHLKQLNRYIRLEGTPLSIPTQCQPWSRSSSSRLAGVSSFGFGGTNCHVILEEAPVQILPTSEIDRPWHVFTLSAKSEKALRELAQRYEKFLVSHPGVSLADVCFTTNTGREQFDHRLAIPTETSVQLGQQLEAFATEKKTSGPIEGRVSSRKPPEIAFLFTGQGSQYVGMGHQLYETQPTFRAALDRCDEILRPFLERSLLEVLYPDAYSSNSKSKIQNSKLDETAYTQPALFAIEYALFQLWQSWGITPKIVMGHSVGEYVAACVAGVFGLEDGLKLIAERARLMQALPKKGTMVAVFGNEQLVRAALQPYTEKVAIAAINGPESVVISGQRDCIKAAIATLAAKGIKSKTLKVSHAFHSPLMEPMLKDFKRVASKVTYSSPQIDLISNLTGNLATAEIATPEYWCRHILQPVRFSQSIDSLARQGYEIFVEIGPKPVLLGMGRHCLPDVEKRHFAFLPSLHPGYSDWQSMLQSLATLYVSGVPIDWSGFDRDYPRRLLQLPTYPFQRKRYWTDSSKNSNYTNSLPEEIEALLRQTAELLPKLLQVLHRHYPENPTVSSLLDLRSEVEQLSEIQQPRLLQQIKETHPKERLAFLIAHIQREVATVLHFEPSQLPEPNLGFFEMGMDSLIAVELKNRLETSLGHSISSTVAFNYPNIQSLAEYLLSEVVGLDGMEKSDAASPDELNGLVTKVENLSDAEAEALLVQKLANL